MIRTQIYIPDEMYQHVMVISKTSGDNFSVIVRKSIDGYLKKTTGKKRAKKFGKGFIGAGKGKIPRDLAQNVDTYLYGGE